jgi:outer membrane protein TolC
MEVKVAQQELQLARGELDGVNLGMKRVSTNLKNILGWPHDQELRFNYQDCRRQVLGNFDPATASLEQSRARDFEIRAFEYHKKLQGYNISLATAKVFPSILFNTQSPDPLSVTNGHGLYVGVGLEIPVWDGLKRFRNVTRQKAVLQQIGAQKTSKESSFDDKWYEALSEIQEKAVGLKNFQIREELARLKTHQKEILYQSGQAPLPALLESRREILLAQRDVARAALQHDVAVLKLREISGDLGYTYVDAKSWQK